MNDERGSAVLLVVLLLPLLLLALAGAIDLGALRVTASRARAAADLAAVVAVNDQDDQALRERGALRLSSDAVSVARAYLASNLASLGSRLADDAGTVAARADVVAFPEGGVDPLDGRRYDHPTVRIRVELPLRAGALRPLVGATLRVRAHVAAAAR